MIKKWIGTLYSKTGGSNRFERIWKLAEVDFKKRYYNDKLGILWTILNPLFQIIIYYFIFKYIRENREERFVLFLYLGIITFSSFGFMARQGLNILNKKRYLLENIQFKKIDIFYSSALTGLMTSAIDYFVYTFVAIWSGAMFNINSFFVVIIVLQTILMGLAVSILLSVVKLYLSDIKNIWSIIHFSLFWVSGIFFSGKILVEVYPILIYLNPLIGILINIRNVFLYGLAINFEYLLINSVQCFVLLLISFWLLSKNWHLVSERT